MSSWKQRNMQIHVHNFPFLLQKIQCYPSSFVDFPLLLLGDFTKDDFRSLFFVPTLLIATTWHAPWPRQSSPGPPLFLSHAAVIILSHESLYLSAQDPIWCLHQPYMIRQQNHHLWFKLDAFCVYMATKHPTCWIYIPDHFKYITQY